MFYFKKWKKRPHGCPSGWKMSETLDFRTNSLWAIKIFPNFTLNVRNIRFLNEFLLKTLLMLMISINLTWKWIYSVDFWIKRALASYLTHTTTFHIFFRFTFSFSGYQNEKKMKHFINFFPSTFILISFNINNFLSSLILSRIQKTRQSYYKKKY